MIKEIQDRINFHNRIRSNIKDMPNVIDKAVSDYKQDILLLNKDQMLLGRDSEGAAFSPSYLQDPYFKNQEAAQAYSRMKYALESSHNSLLWVTDLYPAKDRNTPNLIVTGSFHDAMFITLGSGSYTIGSTYKDASDINAKYNNKVFGLSPAAQSYFYRHFLYQILLKNLYK